MGVKKFAYWFVREAENYFKIQQIPPNSTLCIDGNGFLYWISKKDFGMEFGENFEAINDEVERVIERFQRCGLKLIFFFDGHEINFKLDENQYRTAKREAKWEHLKSLLSKNLVAISSKISSDLPFSSVAKCQLKATLERLGVEVRYCEFEADQEIGRYETGKSDHYCIAKDSDFYFMRNILYVPFESIQFQALKSGGMRMSGLVCSTTKFANYFQLSEEKMIEWAIMLGNDYTQGCTFRDVNYRKPSCPTPDKVRYFLRYQTDQSFISISKHPNPKYHDAIRYSRISYNCQDPRDPSITPPLILPISERHQSYFGLSLEEESICNSYLQSIQESEGSGLVSSSSTCLSHPIPRLCLHFLLSLGSRGGGGGGSEGGGRRKRVSGGGFGPFECFGPKALLALALMQWRVAQRRSSSLSPSLSSSSSTSSSSLPPSLSSSSASSSTPSFPSLRVVFLSSSSPPRISSSPPPNWEALYLVKRFGILCLKLDEDLQIITQQSSSPGASCSRLSFDPRDWIDGYDMHHALRTVSERFPQADRMSREELTELVLNPERQVQRMGLEGEI